MLSSEDKSRNSSKFSVKSRTSIYLERLLCCLPFFLVPLFVFLALLLIASHITLDQQNPSRLDSSSIDGLLDGSERSSIKESGPVGPGTRMPVDKHHLYLANEDISSNRSQSDNRNVGELFDMNGVVDRNHESSFNLTSLAIQDYSPAESRAATHTVTDVTSPQFKSEQKENLQKAHRWQLASAASELNQAQSDSIDEDPVVLRKLPDQQVDQGVQPTIRQTNHQDNERPLANEETTSGEQYENMLDRMPDTFEGLIGAEANDDDMAADESPHDPSGGGGISSVSDESPNDVFRQMQPAMSGNQQQLAGGPDQIPEVDPMSHGPDNRGMVASNQSPDEKDEEDDDSDYPGSQVELLRERNTISVPETRKMSLAGPSNLEEPIQLSQDSFSSNPETSIGSSQPSALLTEGDLSTAAGHYYGKKKKKKKKVIIKKKKVVKKKKKKKKLYKVKVYKKKVIKKKGKKHHHHHHAPDHGKYYMYAKVPKKKSWEFGFKKGNKKHWIMRHEKGHKNKFKTKVKWYDKKSKGKGVHIWDYNHHDKKKKKKHYG